MPRSLVLLALFATAAPLAAQPAPDTVGLAASVARARTALSGLSALWSVDGSGVEWILTDGRTHYTTGREGGAERISPVTLPTGTTIANTSVDVNGRRWAMVVLPLGRTETSRVRILVHEAMHTLQPEQLPRPRRTEAGEGGDLLDGEQGRTWLFVELRALSAALTAKGEAKRTAAHDALRFRARRDALAHATERERLDALDLAEGIPEYTGWRLSGAGDAALAAQLGGADTARVSWVRGVGYWTGPAYGYLLDQLTDGSWRARQRKGERLPALLAEALNAASASVADGDADLEARAWLYGGAAIMRAEKARATANAHRLDSLRARFVSGPVLRIIPSALQVSFDPNGQTPLGDAGTVMTNFRWASTDGAELVAASGALVSPDWSSVQVPLGTIVLADGEVAEARTIDGDGWRLKLPAGWRVSRSGGRVELRPPL